MNQHNALPTFIIIGGGKCGTTSLFYLLNQHPDICLPHKETNFFRYDQGELRPNGKINSLEEYQQLFSKKVKHEKATGEASPSYIDNEKAPYRIKELIPNVKLIAILRNPIDRCYSNYTFDIKNRLIDEKKTTFSQAFTENPDFIERGMYGKYLDVYYKLFSPEQIKIVLFDDFITKQRKVLQDIFHFLEVDDTFVYKSMAKKNASGFPKNKYVTKFILTPSRFKSVITSIFKPFIPKEVRVNLWTILYNSSLKKAKISFEDRQKLIEIYREDILKLQTLINRDLSNWLILPNT